MRKRLDRLRPVTPEDLVRLQREADGLARMDGLLSRLPLGLQAEYLSDEELERLYQIARDPERELSGPLLLTWYNACRTRSSIMHRK